MKWSRYNYILNSKQIGKFIYNSRGNSFTKINDNIFNIINNTEIDLNLLKEEVLFKFKELKIIVDENEDDNLYYNKKFLRYRKSFSNETLLLTIATTTKCNFRCPYCYEEGAVKTSSTREVDDAIISYIRKNKAKYVRITWYGGEPLLNFDSIKYITEILKNKFKGKEISYDIITNGYLLDKEKIEFFRQNDLRFIQITLDGLKEVNDKTRILANGKGSFDVIMNNLRLAINEMPNTRINIRVNTDKNNIEEYPRLHKFLHDEFKDKENFSIAHSFIMDYSGKANSCINRPEQATYNLKLAKENNSLHFNFYPNFYLGGCTANSVNSFVIDPQGRLSKCWVDIGRAEMVVGSIIKKDNVDLNYNLISRYLINSDMFSDTRCKNCFLFPICDGGCPHQRLIGNGKYQCNILPKDIGAYLEFHYVQNYLKD